MKIDAHQHFWIYNPVEYAWMTDNLYSLRRNFLPSNLEPLLLEQGFLGSVAVQARQAEQETEFLLELAEEYPFIKGVVGWVDLRSPDIESSLKKLTRNKILKGIRHVIHDEPDPDFMLGKEFLRGIENLQNYDLTYDILIKPQHLPNTIKLVGMFPDQPFVVDHMAKPNIKDHIMSPWKVLITELAGYQNVFCKVSGLVTEANWSNWQEKDFYPYLDVLFNAFGVDRTMIGSDWPVCTVAGSYGEVMNIVKKYIQDFHVNDQKKILGGNCAQFYKIDDNN